VAAIDRDGALNGAENRAHGKTKFTSRFNGERLINPGAKIFYFRFSEICDLLSPSRLAKRGDRGRHERWVGCGGREQRD